MLPDITTWSCHTLNPGAHLPPQGKTHTICHVDPAYSLAYSIVPHEVSRTPVLSPYTVVEGCGSIKVIAYNSTTEML
jgi:hypothetical protein